MNDSVFNECPACAQLFDEWAIKHEFGETDNAEHLALRAHQDLCLEYQRWLRSKTPMWIFAPDLLECEIAKIDARIKMIEELNAHPQLAPV